MPKQISVTDSFSWASMAFGLVNSQLSQKLVWRLAERVRKEPVIMKRETSVRIGPPHLT